MTPSEVNQYYSDVFKGRDNLKPQIPEQIMHTK